MNERITPIKKGVTPALILNNPKYGHNIGAAIRAASCYGVEQLFYSGKRIDIQTAKGVRLPREERMKGYSEVEVAQTERPFDLFEDDVVPVALEVRENSTQLQHFVHPEKAIYVFGPEDGSIQKSWLGHCHHFVVIPTRHCLNLASAISTLLYDRYTKRQKLGLEPYIPTKDLMQEDRGYADTSL